MATGIGNSLFGSCGVRGIVGDLITDEFVIGLADALADYIGPRQRVCIGRDTRPSSPDLSHRFAEQLRRRGVHVTRLGVLSTPGLYMLTRDLGFDAGVMVTASHNGPEYNGFKLCRSDGMIIDQAAVEARFFDPPSFPDVQAGDEESLPGADMYFEKLAEICPRPQHPLRLVVDCACGPNSMPLPRFLRSHGHDVLEYNCEPDITQCDRDLEPMPETLERTIEFLLDNDADAGLCYDGDNDRVVFLDRRGFLGFQRANAIMSIIALRNAGGGDIVGSVETGRYVQQAIEHAGGRLHRTVVGDVYIARAVKDRGAAAGVEECGHYITPQIGYFSSTIYASTLLLASRDINDVRDELSFIKPAFAAEERIDCPEDAKRAVMTQLAEQMLQWDGEITTIDGVRVDWDDGWLLVRPSGTSPYMKVNAEAFSEQRLNQLVSRGTTMVREAIP